jgi:hypothetical protein
VPNKVTIEVRAAASELVDNPTYRRKLGRDLAQRTLAPRIEQMLWYYAKGQPTAVVELTGKDGTALMRPLGEIEARLLEITALAGLQKPKA